MKQRALAALVVVSLSSLAAPSVRAETCAVMAGAPPELGAIAATERLAFLRKVLARDSRNMLYWSAVFGTAYLGSTAYTLAEGLLHHDRGDRIDDYVGAASSFIGVGLIVFTPKKVLLDHPRFEREIAKGGDTCRLVAEGERLLLRDAADESFGTGRLTQAGNFAFNMGLGLLLVAFGRYQQAAIQTFSGIGVGELMILSQPIGAVKALGSYRNGAMGSLDLEASNPPLSWQMVPQLTTKSGGVAFNLNF
jgi:hypothetical protein